MLDEILFATHMLGAQLNDLGRGRSLVSRKRSYQVPNGVHSCNLTHIHVYITIVIDLKLVSERMKTVL